MAWLEGRTGSTFPNCAHGIWGHCPAQFKVVWSCDKELHNACGRGRCTFSLRLPNTPHVLLLHALLGSQVGAVLWCTPPPPWPVVAMTICLCHGGMCKPSIRCSWPRPGPSLGDCPPYPEYTAGRGVQEVVRAQW